MSWDNKLSNAEYRAQQEFDITRELRFHAIEREGDVNSADSQGRTALHLAAMNTNTFLCKFLLLPWVRKTGAKTPSIECFLGRTSYSAHTTLCTSSTRTGSDEFQKRVH